MGFEAACFHLFPPVIYFVLNRVFLFISRSDEVLQLVYQDQKADMDQFLSSISESQPDVTVSSEESMEVPAFEGKPFRPFQVNSLGSQPEPEGMFLIYKSIFKVKLTFMVGSCFKSR